MAQMSTKQRTTKHSKNAALLSIIPGLGQIYNKQVIKGIMFLVFFLAFGFVFMDTIPMDLDESARIDGASRTRIFWQIIIPLSRPMLAVVAMNGFTGPLGDFALSSVILRNPESYTLPIGLYKLVSDKMGASYTTFAAGAILISIPIVIIFLSLQKHFVSSLTAGGTKG